MNKRIRKKKAKQNMKLLAESFFASVINAEVLGKTIKVDKETGAITVELTEKGVDFFNKLKD